MKTVFISLYCMKAKEEFHVNPANIVTIVESDSNTLEISLSNQKVISVKKTLLEITDSISIAYSRTY